MSRNDFLDLSSPLEPRRIVFGVIFAGLGGLGPLVGVVVSDAPPVVALVGLLFLSVGLGVAFGRTGLELDRRAGIIHTWWGIVVPFRRHQLPLGNPEHVSLSREVRGSGKSRRVVYPVALVEGGDAASRELRAPESYVHGRRLAEQVAAFLDRPLHDWSSGARVVRDAASLDESLRDRLLREQGSVPMPSPTPPGRLRSSREGDVLCCVLPPPGAGMNHLLGLLMLLVIPTLAAQSFLGRDAPWPIAVIVPGFMALPFLFVLPALLHAVIGRDTLRCSSRELALKRWGSLRRARSIPVDELEELAVVQPTKGKGFLQPNTGGSLVARSDERTLAIGKNLTAEEAHWLHDSICYELVPTAFGYRDKPGAARPG